SPGLNVRASATPHDTFMTPPPCGKTSKVEASAELWPAILQGGPSSEAIPLNCLRVEKGASMNEQENVQTNTGLSSSQQAMASLWEQHLRDEFELRDVDKTMETMVADAHNTAIPVMTGGVGGDGVREFYTKWFISQNPPDIETTLVSRTIGNKQLV